MMRRVVLILALMSSLASAKDLTLVSLESQKTVAVADVKTGPTLLVYWASWCKGCSQNIASFLKTSDKDLLVHRIRGISVDESSAAALSYFKAKPELVDFKALSFLDAGGEWAAEEKIDGLPAVVILNAKGERVKLWMGVMKPEEVSDALKLLAAEVTP